MTVLLEQVVNGLTLGSLYGLVALGPALLLGVVRFANFAHGEFLMLSAYVLVGLRAGLGLPYGVAAPLAVLAMGVVGFLFARTVGTTLLSRSWRFQLVGTLAVTVLLESGIILAFGALPHSVPVALATRTVTLAGVTISWHRVLVFVAVAVAFLGLRLLLTRARIGKAMRALAQNREAAVDLGIDVRRIATVTFVLAGALAGVGGVLFAPLYTVTPTMGAPVTFKALAAVVMAGAEARGPCSRPHCSSVSRGAGRRLGLGAYQGGDGLHRHGAGAPPPQSLAGAPCACSAAVARGPRRAPRRDAGRSPARPSTYAANALVRSPSTLSSRSPST
jgi:branched-chain amino acid transport system permease protein